MGSHYTSIHVRNSNQSALIAVVEALTRGNKEARVLVGPALSDWIGLYPNDAIGPDEFSLAVSERTKATVLMFILHDGDLILYKHFQSGELVDEYSSDPDYFEEVATEDRERLKGRPGLFGAIVDSHTKVQAIASLLGRKREVFEEGRFGSLAKLLGIRNASTSYAYLTHGEAHGVTRRKEFIHVPDLTAEKAERKAIRTGIRTKIKLLKSSGVLCLDLKPKTFLG